MISRWANGEEIQKSIMPPDGIVCPRCNEVAETRQHPVITGKQLKQPFYD